METRKEWTKPELNLYGSIENITEQTFSKSAGTGDSINLVINGDTINIPIPGERGTLGVIS
ncbi:hypothetical protein IQ259_12465 [Fortiea sp. LEGE XX443]|uniref:hypothetical protein n=1 Tax=Fortiea sp. LEGE XX443 TaxID=1828611 RepID=UPI0018804C44|nr:hypothetical protein [Fortiea sp. LEGE XX443]MBE9005840.1 hypothetical protein [Fortiea sp. LEGE XX443]